MTSSQPAPWGLSTCIDCYDCNPETIRSEASIRQFVAELVALIDMKTFGPCQVVNFGEEERVAGFSMVQLIETSCITGHFANASNAAYLDIFSCKPYDVQVAAEFCERFFGASSSRVQVNERR